MAVFSASRAGTVCVPGEGCYRCPIRPPPRERFPLCRRRSGCVAGTVGLTSYRSVLVLGEGKSLIGRVLLYDAMDMKFRELKLRRDSECPVCGDNPTVTELIDYQQFCGLPSQGEAAG